MKKYTLLFLTLTTTYAYTEPNTVSATTTNPLLQRTSNMTKQHPYATSGSCAFIVLGVPALFSSDPRISTAGWSLIAAGLAGLTGTYFCTIDDTQNTSHVHFVEDKHHDKKNKSQELSDNSLDPQKNIQADELNQRKNQDREEYLNRYKKESPFLKKEKNNKE